MLIEQIELALIVALLAYGRFRRSTLSQPPPNVGQDIPPSAAADAWFNPETAVLLARTGKTAKWTYHSARPDGHPDIAEALRTPNMAVRHPNGQIEEGVQ